MGQTQKLSKNNTTVSRSETEHFGTQYEVRLHGSLIVSFDDKFIRLDHCGYRTVTTKARMNQCANEYNLPYSVYQVNREWYVRAADATGVCSIYKFARAAECLWIYRTEKLTPVEKSMLSQSKSVYHDWLIEEGRGAEAEMLLKCVNV